MRLDKFLCEMNMGTRSQVKACIRKGLVTVNGVPVKTPELKVEPGKDTVLFQGTLLTYQKFHYYMLNKPSGVVSATRDEKEKTVLDLFPADKRKGLFPAGRLDKDTVGLLLLTDDGALAHRLLSPRKHIDKTYLVQTKSPVSPEALKALETGVDIGEKHPTLPAKAVLTEENTLLLTIREGKFHQVKRMLQAVENEVVGLKRISFAALSLDDGLAPGAYRELTQEEVDSLYECT